MDSKENQTVAEITQQRIENVRQWVLSPEGQEAIVAGLQRAHAQAAKFRDAERVDPAKLLEPITI